MTGADTDPEIYEQMTGYYTKGVCPWCLRRVAFRPYGGYYRHLCPHGTWCLTRFQLRQNPSCEICGTAFRMAKANRHVLKLRKPR